jgi:hypothetical protein
MAFALTSAVFLAYALHRYVGWRNSVDDVRSAFTQHMGERRARVTLLPRMPDTAKAPMRERVVVAVTPPHVDGLRPQRNISRR